MSDKAPPPDALVEIAKLLSNTVGGNDPLHAQISAIVERAGLRIGRLRPVGWVPEDAPARGITRKPGVRSGAPVFTGTRITHEAVRAMIQRGSSQESFRRCWPSLSTADIEEARDNEVAPRVMHCPCGCLAVVEIKADPCGCEHARDHAQEDWYPMVLCDEHNVSTVLEHETDSARVITPKDTSCASCWWREADRCYFGDPSRDVDGRSEKRAAALCDNFLHGRSTRQRTLGISPQGKEGADAEIDG